MRILLVDDNATFRGGLRDWLRASFGIDVIGEATDGIQAVALARNLKPDMVILDVVLADGASIGVTRQILEDSPTTKVVALSMYDDAAFIQGMQEAGAAAYVLKDAMYEELPRVLNRAARCRAPTYLTFGCGKEGCPSQTPR